MADYGLHHYVNGGVSNAPFELLSRYTHVNQGGVNILYIMQDLLYTVQNIISGIASISPYSYSDGLLSTKYEIDVGHGRPTVTIQYREIGNRDENALGDDGYAKDVAAEMCVEPSQKNAYVSAQGASEVTVLENANLRMAVPASERISGDLMDRNESQVEEIEVVPDFATIARNHPMHKVANNNKATDRPHEGTLPRLPHRINMSSLIRKQALKTTLFQRKPRPRAKFNSNKFNSVAAGRMPLPMTVNCGRDPSAGFCDQAKNCLACSNETTTLRAEPGNALTSGNDPPNNSYGGFPAGSEDKEAPSNFQSKENASRTTSAYKTTKDGGLNIASLVSIIGKKTAAARSDGDNKSIKLKRYSCKYCGKSFNTPSKKETHERVHTGEKPFACRYCNAFFTQLGSKRRHEQRHKQILGKPHSWCSCSDCITSQKLKQSSNESEKGVG